MNRLAQQLRGFFSRKGNDNTLLLLQSMQELITEIEQDLIHGLGIESANARFKHFIRTLFSEMTAIEDVLYHHKKDGDLWTSLLSEERSVECNLPICRQLNAETLTLFENELPVLEKFLGPNPLGQNKKVAGISFFNLCDYLFILKKNGQENKLISFLDSFFKYYTKFQQFFQQENETDKKISQLEQQIMESQVRLTTTERKLKRRVYEIHNLLEISNELYSILNLNQLINSALLIIVGQVGCQKAFAFLYDSNLRKYSRRFTKGLSQLELKELEVAVDHPLIPYFESNYKPIAINQLLKEPELSSLAADLMSQNIEFIAPLITNDRVQGFIGCGTLLTEKPFSENEMEILNILINIISISVANAQTYEEVKNLSLTDAMTNLNNYRYFEDRLKEEINRGKRNNTPVSLLMLDIDHFKNYNDTLGHQAGDDALRSIGWILKNTVREEDIVNRYGGEEFCVILPGIDKKIIPVLGERIRAKIEEYPFYKENVQPGGSITVSLGGACFSKDADNFEELVYKADQALYKSKKEGRNRLTIFSEDM